MSKKLFKRREVKNPDSEKTITAFSAFLIAKKDALLEGGVDEKKTFFKYHGNERGTVIKWAVYLICGTAIIVFIHSKWEVLLFASLAILF